jgi:hypothetical protein
MNLIFYLIQKKINKNGKSLLILAFKTAKKYLKNFQQAKHVFDVIKIICLFISDFLRGNKKINKK